jgi:hypothetical protein
MKHSLSGLALLLATGMATSSADAQSYATPVGYYPPPYYNVGYPPGPRQAPDMCGGYFYCTNGCQWYGPSYCVRPPFEPFNGVQPLGVKPPPTPMQFAAQKGYGPMPGYPYGPAQPPGPPNVALPINPWTRSPRDFFMWGDAQQERHTRETRPPFVP